MENNNDKSKTEKFNPAQSRKRTEIERSKDDIYSEARKTPEYSFDKYDKADKNAEKGNKRLVILIITLAVLLVIVCALAIYVIKTSSPKENYPVEPPQIEVEAEEEKEKEEEVLKEESYSFVFYPESINEKEDYLSIRADLFDADMKKKDTASVKINHDTDILVNGERISSNSFVYIVESLAGEQIVFDGVLNTKEKVVVKLSYNGEIGGEEAIEPEDTPAEEPNQEPEENEEPEPIIIDGI